MDPRKLTADYLTKEMVWERAEEFRSDYIKNEDIPVEIEEIAQGALGIDIIPISELQDECDLVGFISLNFKNIYVDADLYHPDHKNGYNRIRFTIAHELGHYHLHRSKIDEQKFKDDYDWIKFRMNIKPEINGWFEFQAHEFGGRLLAPLDQLIKHTRKAKEEIEKTLSWNDKKISKDQLIAMLAPKISPHFHVSDEVIEKRLEKDLVFQVI